MHDKADNLINILKRCGVIFPDEGQAYENIYYALRNAQLDGMERQIECERKRKNRVHQQGCKF